MSALDLTIAGLSAGLVALAWATDTGRLYAQWFGWDCWRFGWDLYRHPWVLTVDVGPFGFGVSQRARP